MAGDAGGRHQLFNQGHGDFARDQVRVQLSLLTVFQQGAGIDAAGIDYSHGPPPKTPFRDFLVVQQHHILMACITLDHAIEVADNLTPTFQHLHEDAATIDQNTCHALFGIVLACTGAYGIDGCRSGINGAAGALAEGPLLHLYRTESEALAGITRATAPEQESA